MADVGLLSAEELASGHPAEGGAKAVPPLRADGLPRLLAGAPTEREVDVQPAFRVGDSVRARNVQPTGHTRLPRYVRGKTGRIVREHGTHVFPDTNAHGMGEQPQPLYCVRFEAVELWGQGDTSRSAVHLGLWESYLARA